MVSLRKRLHLVQFLPKQQASFALGQHYAHRQQFWMKDNDSSLSCAPVTCGNLTMRWWGMLITLCT